MSSSVAASPTVPCRICGKHFINVEEHITKSHHTNYVHFKWVPPYTSKSKWTAGEVYGGCYEPWALSYEGVTWTKTIGSDGKGAGRECVLYDYWKTSECEPGTAKHAFAKKHGDSWREVGLDYDTNTGEVFSINLFKTLKSGKNAGQQKLKELYIKTVVQTRDPKPSI
jgi:hypothetical protein